VTYPTPTVTLSASPANIEVGQSTVLTWSSAHADTVEIDQGIGNVALNGSLAVSPTQSTTYTITARGAGGTATASETVTVTYPTPTVTLSASPANIEVGQSTVLTWSSAHADTVEIDQGIGNVALNGSLAVSPTQSTTYTITARGAGGTATASETVTVTYPAPTVTLSASPANIEVGQSTVLTWSSAHADTVEIDQGIGNVALNGSLAVSPTQGTTYTITARGAGGTATSAVTITMTTELLPNVTLSANPTYLSVQGRVVLSWNATHASFCSIEPSIGPVATSGSIGIFPSRTTEYTITAVGPGGTSTATAAVSVENPAPVVTFSSTPSSIGPGESSTLTWTSTGADSCEIDAGIGSVDPSGSVVVIPSGTTVYTISARGPGGTTTARARVDVGNGYSYGEPTPAEQVHLEAVNRARLNPSGEALRLGIDLNEGISPGTIGEETVQPLVFNARLTEAARLHSQDMMDRQYFAHDSLDGRTMYDRVLASAYSPETLLENLGKAISISPLDPVATALILHDNLFVDAGVTGRGHRLNILDANVREAGFGFASGTFEGFPHAILLTCDYASSQAYSNPFLTGVVYDDQNGDEAYTAGEGIQDVEIRVLEAGAQTRTCGTGGYAILLSPGAYTVEAALSDGRTYRKNVALTSYNVKVDFLLSEFGPAQPSPQVTLGVTPAILALGDSATLSWSSVYATSCVIEPDIGEQGIEGSLRIFPTATTTYRIRATGAGGTVEKEVTVIVYDPAGTVSVSMSAQPASIQEGQSAMLVWYCLNATNVSLDNGIGPVALNGSMSVQPASTTTYTITATGPGGTSTASVTVTVTYVAPTVILSANPGAIPVGKTSTLNWSSTHANTVSIDPAIGNVAPNGSISIFPAETTTYTITATGAGGTTSATATVTVSSLLAMQITSPLPNEWIAGPSVMVQGTILNPTGNEVGVNVNGVAAIVVDDHFVANHVPLEQGENVLNVVATDAAGNSALASVVVNADTSVAYVGIYADVESGIPPFQTTLHVMGSFGFEWSLLGSEGPGVVDVAQNSPREYRVGMSADGIYYLTVNVMDRQGVSHSDTIAISLWNRDRLDSLLKTRWDVMKASLIAGDTQGALQSFAVGSRERYGQIFDSISSVLPAMASEMREIGMIYVRDQVAKYRIRRQEEVMGEMYDITYYIYFKKDYDGLWRIDSF